MKRSATGGETSQGSVLVALPVHFLGGKHQKLDLRIVVMVHCSNTSLIEVCSNNHDLLLAMRCERVKVSLLAYSLYQLRGMLHLCSLLLHCSLVFRFLVAQIFMQLQTCFFYGIIRSYIHKLGSQDQFGYRCEKRVVN